MAQKYSQIIKKLGSKRVKKDEPLAQYTTFKIGGPADLFYEAKTTEELVRAVKLARKLKIPYFVLGGGSKILVSDKGFFGLVILVVSRSYAIKKEKIIVDAGLPLSELVDLASQDSLSGLEFAAGIPGTVGGAVRGNAGAWQKSIGEKVLRVKVLSFDNKIKWLLGEDCHFSYRQSRFKKNNEIILSIELGLAKGNKIKIKERIKTNLEKRKKDPLEPSSGCIFVNPKPTAAGQLIEESGLKGKKVGHAQISPQHANFIVNLGGAKAKDVVRLIKLAKKEVKNKFGVQLKEEINLVDSGKI